MGQDKLNSSVTLMGEEGASLSSGSLRLYAIPNSSLLIPNSAIGCVDLYNYDPLNRRCAVGIMVANEYRRQGFALAMLKALEMQFFNFHFSSFNSHFSFFIQALQELSTTHYQLHTLYADIAVTNTASLALFKKAGYTECGHFKDWLLVKDKYVDSIRMQKIWSAGLQPAEKL